ncbi:MAG: hypothetical protein Q9185_002841 [Variospora sp. 1 TL-2023]
MAGYNPYQQPGYQQGPSSQSQFAPNGTTNQYGGTPQGGYGPQGTPHQDQGYFPSHGQANVRNDERLMILAEQAHRMSLDGDAAAAPYRPNKKKNRHAYHNLEQPAAPVQSFGGVAQGQYGYANTDNSQQMSTGHPYAGQQVTPAMNQFPAQANAPFTPGLQAPSPGFRTQFQQVPSTAGPGVSQGKVDPEQIPSIPRLRDAATQYYLDNVYPTMEQHIPPPAAVPFVAHDQGNSSPKYARLTLNNIPSTTEALATTALPLGIVLQPLALLQEGEQTIPVLDFGEIGPPRCRRCRTYINPFMTFRSGGNKLVCNMCTFPNDVSPEYFAPTDPSGVRVDRPQRPELTVGTVEFMVPKEYWAKEPVGLHWLFLIDVGQEAIQRGFLQAFCQGVLLALYGDEHEKEDEDQDGETPEVPRRIPAGSQVAFVTFDRSMYFFNCSAKLEQAQMLVMPDLEEPFVPLGSNGLFVDPYESKHVITDLLRRLSSLFSRQKSPEPALLPALKATQAALAATGGKIICSLSALPTWGPGRLILRDKNDLHGIENERKLFQTEHADWKKVASNMVQSGIGVDFFLAAASGGYMDIATIGHVSALSGGETYFYPTFTSPRDVQRLTKEIEHTVTRETGYQALMKVRCSNGLQVSSYHGNFLQHSFGADLELGSIDADKALGVMFSYDGQLDSKLDAHFQCALLYTTAGGERRVRCTNTVASVSESLPEVMRFIDQDAVVSMIAKEGQFHIFDIPLLNTANVVFHRTAATRMTERTLKDIRNALTEKTIDILAGHRKTSPSGHPAGQLVLPENLKEFAMYILGLIKSRAFKAGHEPSDRRTHTMRFLKSASPLELSLFLYPRIIPLHSLPDNSCFPNPETGHLVVPESIRALFGRIEDGGAYLVDDGQICLLWLHEHVSPNLLEDLFGPGHTNLADLDPSLSSLPVLETHLNAQVRNLIAYWSSIRGSKALTLQLARQGLDGAEYEFARMLVEDRNNDAQNYVDWLVHLHRGIQVELNGGRRKEEGEGVGAGLEGAMAGLSNLIGR